MSSQDGRRRLVGIGAATKGIFHDLEDDSPVLVGRDPGCAIVIARAAEGGASVSRHHAVVEWSAKSGWCVYDSGSTNGTSLLRQGIPPTIPLTVPKRYPLDPGDVIELAGSHDYQFAFQAVSSPRRPAEDVTQRLIRVTRASVQQLVDGSAVMPQELGPEGLRVVRGAGGRLWLEPGAGAEGALLRFSRSGGKTAVEGIGTGCLLNRAPLTPGAPVALRDKDHVAVAGEPDAVFVFLDPDAVEPRALSDVLLGADRITIGTAADNSCRLGDPSLSRHHATVWREGAALMVRDLGSANGTMVDNRRVTNGCALSQGSRVWFGRLPFVVDAACWSASRSPAIAVDIRFAKVSVEIAGKLRLQGVSFGVRQGELVGLLGPSASGKSTLLRALAGQARMASGDIYVNGRPVRGGGRGGEWYRDLLGFGPDTNDVGFVQQIDLLQPELTVREILQFAARHMGLGVTEARRRTDRAGEQCNLGPLMDRVAIAGSGQMNLSGGQLKRVCVAIEVLRQPRVLVLDEPTTGQDPKNTKDLMDLFRALAQSGVTVLMSTHDLGTLAAFDKVTALCLGHLAYFGPPEEFASYFGAPTPEHVYASLPDREDKLADAARLAERFRASTLYTKFCRVEE